MWIDFFLTYGKDILLGAIWVSIVFFMWWAIATIITLLVMVINKIIRLIWLSLRKIPAYGRYLLMGTVWIGVAFVAWRLAIVLIIILTPVVSWLVKVTSG